MRLDVERKTPKQLLNPASGFLEGYSHTLNPYAGCSYACSYCYVRQMPIALFRGKEWGTWVDVKEGAALQLRKELAKARKKGGELTIFMSSSTDPYQPVEHREQVTRSLLEVMAEEQPDFLFVQTRSPLVVRDFDLLQALGTRVRVSMTLETDLEEVREVFAPGAPSLHARMRALEKVVAAGVPAQATVAPVLPHSDEFAGKIKALGVDRVCVDDFFMGDGSGGKRTERLRIRELYERHGWSEWYGRDVYRKLVSRLEEGFSKEKVFISQQGFMSP